MRGRGRVWSALSLILLLSPACVAPGDSLAAGSVLRSIDNDSLDDSDDQYTSGVSLSYISRHEPSFARTPLPEWIGGALDDHWPFEGQDQRFVIYSLSHRVFTPTDLSARGVVEGDIPYAGLVYATATVGSQSPRALNAFALTLGIVGPAALGEEIQSGVHSLIDSEDPKGWDEQLDNEPLLNVGYEHRRRLLRSGAWKGVSGDVLGAFSASAGNLQTQATLASTARVGFRVPSNFHMQSHFLAEESLGLRANDPDPKRRSLYLFTGFAATALANAIYLDGNTFSDSHSVDHDHYVLRGSVGIAGSYGPVLGSLAYERATLPWDHPDGLDDESYLRLALSWDF